MWKVCLMRKCSSLNLLENVFPSSSKKIRISSFSLSIGTFCEIPQLCSRFYLLAQCRKKSSFQWSCFDIIDGGDNVWQNGFQLWPQLLWCKCLAVYYAVGPCWHCCPCNVLDATVALPVFLPWPGHRLRRSPHSPRISDQFYSGSCHIVASDIHN